MADLSVNVPAEGRRVLDFVLGAALGVALSAGLVEPVKLVDTVQASLLRPDITFRAGLFSTSNSASPYSATPTWTPAANSLIVALVANVATSPPTPTVSAHGVTLTQVGGTVALGSGGLLSLWIGDAGASPTSVAAAATVSGSPTGCVVVEFEVTNWNRTGNILDAIASVNSATGTATSGSVPVRLDAMTEVQAAVYLSFFVHVANEATTGQGGNWVLNASATGSFNTPATGAGAQTNEAGYSSPATASWLTSSAWAGLVATIVSPAGQDPGESARIADTVTAVLNPLRTSGFDELLHVQETATPAPLDLSPGLLAETLHVQETATPFLPLQRSVQETGLLAEFGQVDLYGLGAWVKVQDTVTAALVAGSSDLNASGFNEGTTAHLVDGPAVGTLNPEQASGFDEALKIADSATPTLNPLFAPNPAESLKVADAVLGPTLDPEQTSTPAESLKVQDSVLGPILNPEQASPAESLKVADTVLGQTLDPEQTSTPAELLHITDGPAQPALWLATSGFDEALKVQDAPSASLTVLLASGFDESLKIADIVSAGGAIVETLHVQDVVTGPTLDPEQTSGFDEAGKLADTVSASLTVLLPSANPSEAVKVQDTVSTLLNPLFTSGFDEALHVVDDNPPTAAIGGGVKVTPDEVLHVVDTVVNLLLNPEQASPSESLKLADVVTPSLTPELPDTNPAEAAKVADTVLGPTLDPEQTSSAAESLKIADAVLGPTLNPEQASPAEALKLADAVTGPTLDPEQATAPGELVHITDGPALAALWLAASGFDESLHVQDQISGPIEAPLFASGFDELVHVVDDTPPAASLGSGVKVTPDESLHVVDTVTPSINPEFASGFDDSLKLADTVVVALTPLLPDANPAESLHVQDTVSQPVLNPLRTSGFDELVHAQDAAAPAIGLVQTLTEPCKLSDSVVAVLDPEQTVGAETVKLADIAQALLNPLQSTGVGEALHVQDAASLSLNPLFAATTPELLHLTDLTAKSSYGTPRIMKQLYSSSTKRGRLYSWKRKTSPPISSVTSRKRLLSE